MRHAAGTHGAIGEGAAVEGSGVSACWATASMFLVRGIVAMTLVCCTTRFKWFDDVRFFSKETFSNIGPLLAMNLKSVAMGVWGWWAFDFFTLMASYLGPTEVAT